MRHLTLEVPVDLVVADLSFISLATVAPSLLGPNAQPGADVVCLVKPQFEAGRAEVSKGRGVIRQPDIWRRVLDEVGSAFAAQGAAMMDVMVSPLRGADGNVEFLAHLRAHAAQVALGEGASLDAPALDAVVAEAAGTAP